MKMKKEIKKVFWNTFISIENIDIEIKNLKKEIENFNFQNEYSENEYSINSDYELIKKKIEFLEFYKKNIELSMFTI